MAANHTNFASEEKSNSVKPKEEPSVSPSDVSLPARLKHGVLLHWFPLEKKPKEIYHGLIRSSKYTVLNKGLILRDKCQNINFKVSFGTIDSGP